MLLIGAALCIALVAMLTGSARAGVTLEERKLPMKFSWVACQPNCRGWVSAVGIVTAETPRDFNDFARDRQLNGETVVLDSSGGSVNDSIALGRQFRELGMSTTVGVSVLSHSARGERAHVSPEAYCESMCVFLLLAGKSRYVPEQAHVRPGAGRPRYSATEPLLIKPANRRKNSGPPISTLDYAPALS